MNPPAIDHIGLVVDDIAAAARLLSALFGVEPGPVVPKEGLGLCLQKVPFANITVELIQYTDPASWFKEAVGKEPGQGHLAVRVADLEDNLAVLKEHGAALAPKCPLKGASGTLAFNLAETSHGLRFELTEPV